MVLLVAFCVFWVVCINISISKMSMKMGFFIRTQTISGWVFTFFCVILADKKEKLIPVFGYRIIIDSIKLLTLLFLHPIWHHPFSGLKVGYNIVGIVHRFAQ
jgi:hypothetical protein